MANDWVGYYEETNFNAGLESGYTWPQIGGEIENDDGTQMGNGNWGNSSSAAYAKWWYSNGIGHGWTAMPNAYYVGSGNIGGFWNTSGTYTGTLSSDGTMFRYGGPGPGW